jgi:hypothetical protein
MLVRLKQRLDRRLVKTFLGLVMVILVHRHRTQGLLLSELGGYLLGAEQSRAGTKRISNLVHSEKWEARLIEEYLWQRATERVEEIWDQGEQPLVIWDESVLEKPESLQAESLCAVRSSKAVRLKRIKPGFFNPPGGRPIFVPGFHWLKVLVIGQKGNPMLAHMRWWTTRGEQKSQKRAKESAVLAHCISGIVALRAILGSLKFLCMRLVLFCVGPRIMVSWMKKDNIANRVRSPKANVPGTIACSGMLIGVVNARRASLPSRSSTLLTTSPSG